MTPATLRSYGSLEAHSAPAVKHGDHAGHELVGGDVEILGHIRVHEPNVSRYLDVTLEPSGDRSLCLDADLSALGKNANSFLTEAADAGFGTIALYAKTGTAARSIVGAEHAGGSRNHGDTEHSDPGWGARCRRWLPISVVEGKDGVVVVRPRGRKDRIALIALSEDAGAFVAEAADACFGTIALYASTGTAVGGIICPEHAGPARSHRQSEDSAARGCGRRRGRVVPGEDARLRARDGKSYRTVVLIRLSK